MKGSSNKSLATGLLVLSLIVVGLVAWFGGGAATNVLSSVPEEASSAERANDAKRCASVECAPLQCKDTERSYLRPGACCPRCVPRAMAQEAPQDCSAVQCATCPPDARPEQVTGECCPVCRPQSNAACDAGRGEYEQKIAGLETELRACASDEDCIVASYSDSCRYVCPSPVNKLALGKVVEQLRTIGSAHCGSCPETPAQCATQVDQSVVCRAGACAFAQ